MRIEFETPAVLEEPNAIHYFHLRLGNNLTSELISDFRN